MIFENMLPPARIQLIRRQFVFVEFPLPGRHHAGRPGDENHLFQGNIQKPLNLIYGCILLAIVMFLPGGFMGAVERLKAKAAARRGGHRHA